MDDEEDDPGDEEAAGGGHQAPGGGGVAAADEEGVLVLVLDVGVDEGYADPKIQSVCKTDGLAFRIR